jgi:hypothetical protein
MENDTVETAEESLAVLEWADGSITRLGSNTKILITKAFYTEDISQTQIAFSLLQ